MYTSLEDIKLESIDFKWISQTTKISHLKRAIRLIELDGDYFVQLKNACYDRIGQIDPSQKRIVIDNRMLPEAKEEVNKQLEEWEKGLRKKQPEKGEKQGEELDPQIYFDNSKSKKDNKKQSQNEKIKGNEAFRSKDYNQAIKYYTSSVTLDPTNYQSYCNRALIYIRQKQFQKAISDCDNCLRLNGQYTKGYHRRAKALIGLKNRVEAYKDLQQALKIEPENSEINSQLKQLRAEMSESQLKQLEGSQFKKIIIEEDSDDSDEEIKQK